MRKLLLIILVMTWAAFCNGQNVGIGTNSPSPSAQLDISSTNKGVLLPRITSALRQSIANPAKGLLVYDSTLKEFHYYDGDTWLSILNQKNYSGWKTYANGNIYNDPELSLVNVISPKMSAINGLNYTGGGLIVRDRDYSFGIYDYVTIDYQGIEARAQVAGHYTRSLHLNRYGGNVGIGTADLAVANAKFMVNGTVGASVAMFGSDKMGVTISADNPEVGFNYYYNNGTRTMKAGYAAYMGMSPQNGSIYIGNFAGNASTANWGAITGAVSRITLLQNGNVGIGTTNPTYKLSVNGNIRSKEVVVESGWADYVFEDNYQLPSLDSTAAFIKANKHLPGIPSAKEIQENGLQLGDVQTKMMAKIEELTLYVIELKKEIETLKNK